MTQDRAQLLITAVDQTRSAFDSVRGNLAKLGDESNRVKSLLAGLGVSLSVAGFVTLIKSAIDAADQINKLSQKIGISVEALSTLRFAAQLSDVSLETLQKGIKGLSQSIVEASTGVGDGAALFQALGLSAIGVTDVTIRLSHRGIFNRFLSGRGLAEKSEEILRTVDKLSKVGEEEVRNTLTELAGADAARDILVYIRGAGGTSAVGC